MALNDFMLDLETLGTRPGCPVVSIGCVGFDYRVDDVSEPFYAIVNVQAQVRAGLTIDANTLRWWTEQSRAAQAALLSAMNDAMPLTDAVTELGEWVRTQADPGMPVRVWGNGAGFDQPILLAAMTACGCDDRQFWNFWDERCHRTLKNLPELLGAPRIRGPKPTVAHNAGHDAKAQAIEAVMLLRSLAGLPPSRYALRAGAPDGLPETPASPGIPPDPMPAHMANAMAEMVPREKMQTCDEPGGIAALEGKR